jgi:hypothetical protein
MACRRAISAALAGCIIVAAASPARPTKIKRFISKTSVRVPTHPSLVPGKYSELLSRLVRRSHTRRHVLNCVARFRTTKSHVVASICICAINNRGEEMIDATSRDKLLRSMELVSLANEKPRLSGRGLCKWCD